jgi:hypothetical protein
LAWIIVVCILFLMPVSPEGIPGNPNFTWEVVNYAPLRFAAAAVDQAVLPLARFRVKLPVDESLQHELAHPHRSRPRRRSRHRSLQWPT